MKCARAMMMAAVALFTACASDPYETGDGTYSHVTADFVEAYTDANCNINTMLTDEGRLLKFEEPFTAGKDGVPDSLYRCTAYYDIQEGDKVKVRSLSLVPTPHITEPADTLLRDPLDITAAWVAKNGRYVNLSIRFKTGLVKGEAVRHLVCVVKDSIVGETTHLTLHHDQNGTPEHYTEDSYISLRATEIDTKYVTIHTNTYEKTDFTRSITMPDVAGH